MRLFNSLAWTLAVTDVIAKAVVAPRVDAVVWQTVESQHEQRDTSENANELWKRRGGGGGGGSRGGSGSSGSSGSSSSGSSGSSSGSSSGGEGKNLLVFVVFDGLGDGEVSAGRSATLSGGFSHCHVVRS